ncbi:hypothetical protein SFOMI_5372 [Sphingobium fuliginis]|uniref:Uncharacterized protein n=1 Tax=Sphingobium fuliginis (strain ATCC 27551) TaxID=336203 RepID=A0A292ZMW6_SPHSA|nr:hypothetical protein SFOMI_5372 [Sphingobium fuliginis]
MTLAQKRPQAVELKSDGPAVEAGGLTLCTTLAHRWRQPVCQDVARAAPVALVGNQLPCRHAKAMLDHRLRQHGMGEPKASGRQRRCVEYLAVGEHGDLQPLAWRQSLRLLHPGMERQTCFQLGTQQRSGQSRLEIGGRAHGEWAQRSPERRPDGSVGRCGALSEQAPIGRPRPFGAQPVSRDVGTAWLEQHRVAALAAQYCRCADKVGGAHRCLVGNMVETIDERLLWSRSLHMRHIVDLAGVDTDLYQGHVPVIGDRAGKAALSASGRARHEIERVDRRSVFASGEASQNEGRIKATRQFDRNRAGAIAPTGNAIRQDAREIGKGRRILAGDRRRRPDALRGDAVLADMIDSSRQGDGDIRQRAQASHPFGQGRQCCERGPVDHGSHAYAVEQCVGQAARDQRQTIDLPDIGAQRPRRIAHQACLLAFRVVNERDVAAPAQPGDRGHSFDGIGGGLQRGGQRILRQRSRQQGAEYLGSALARSVQGPSRIRSARQQQKAGVVCLHHEVGEARAQRSANGSSALHG